MHCSRLAWRSGVRWTGRRLLRFWQRQHSSRAQQQPSSGPARRRSRTGRVRRVHGGARGSSHSAAQVTRSCHLRCRLQQPPHGRGTASRSVQQRQRALQRATHCDPGIGAERALRRPASCRPGRRPLRGSPRSAAAPPPGAPPAGACTAALPPAALDVAAPAALDARRQDGALEPAGAGKSHQVPLLFAHHVELEGLAGAVVAREHQVFVPSRSPLHLPPRPHLCAQGLAKAAYGQRREGSRRLTKRGATLFAAHKDRALCVAAQRLCAEVTHQSVTHRCAARGFIRRNCAVWPTTPARLSIDFKGSHWQSHTRIAAESAAWRASAHHVDLPLTVSPNEGPHCTRLLDEMDRLAGGFAEQEVQAAGEDDMMASHPGRGRGLASGPAWYSPRASRVHTGTRTCASIERSPLPDPSI